MNPSAPEVERPLNLCGFSLETIAAEYETDAALAEAGQNIDDLYFKAAWSAENAHRTLDWIAAGVLGRKD